MGDHNWAKSIHFKDPSGVQLEYCRFTPNLNANDARMQDRFFATSVRRLGLEDLAGLKSASKAGVGSDVKGELLVNTPRT